MATHIGTLRRKYASNRKRVQEELELNDLAYYEMVFETGCMFLEDKYPRSEGAHYEYCYKAFSDSKEFWSFWKREWKNWQDEYLFFLEIDKSQLELWNWKEYMLQMIMEGEVERNFNHFIKRFL